MPDAPYRVAHVSEIVAPDETEPALGNWHPVRIHFFVASGRASFTIGDETVEAPAGTFVYVPDPAVARGATALEPGTTLLAVGGEPGKAFEVSPWERKYLDRE